MPQPSTSSSVVVSARMRTEAEMFGAKRLASRRKTADNDEDLRYLSQLHLTPWRPSRFKPYKVQPRDIVYTSLVLVSICL